MAFTDITEPTQAPIKVACDNIRGKLSTTLSLAEVSLHQVRTIFQKYGRPAIAAEFGSGSAVALQVYLLLKEAVEIGQGVSVKDLPE